MGALEALFRGRTVAAARVPNSALPAMCSKEGIVAV